VSEGKVYAIIAKGRHQYRVSEGEVIRLQRIEGEVGEEVTFSPVLLLGEGGTVETSSDGLKEARVRGVILQQGRGPKIIVFKKKRRKNYRRRTGHRQDFTAVRITQISRHEGAAGHGA
jgi:large subunit ribosomal protein L21